MTSAFLPAAEEAAALRTELDQVRAELARLESPAGIHDPARWQQRQRAEYDVPEVAELRVQVKALEKSLLEKRAALREYLLARSPEIRDLLHVRDAAYAHLAELGVKAGLVDNEIRLAEQAEPPVPGKAEGLRAERKSLAAEEEAARAAAEAAQEAFLARQKDLATGDPATVALQAEIVDLQARFEQARRQMNERIDALPESEAIETQRQAQVERVRQLRQREQELKAQLSLSE